MGEGPGHEREQSSVAVLRHPHLDDLARGETLPGVTVNLDRMQHGCRRPEQGSQGQAQSGLWGSVKTLVTPAELHEVAVAEFFSQCGKHLK
uniref:hypothetical protein n=1 Tax=unclassified Pseudomonas TaxID=196821 RepID=UPI0030D9A809